MVFKEVVSDEQILEAVNKCLEDATVPVDCIANKLQNSGLKIGVRRLRERLTLLEKDQKVLSKKVGTGLGFRPKTE